MILYMFNVLVFILEFSQLVINSIVAFAQSFKSLIISTPKKSVIGEKILITGSGRGIGRDLAIKFSKLGAVIIVWDINKQNAEETVNLIKKSGGIGYSFEVDVSDYKQVEQAAIKVRQGIGEVSILINNAGILNALPLLHLTQNMIEKTLRVNLLSHLWTTKVFLPRMISEGKGHIVAMSSNCGIYGKSYFTDYSASKAGIIGFMSSLGEELLTLKKTFIKLTTLCPAAINTGLSKVVATRFPKLLPILEIDEATDIMVDAILREESMLVLPVGYRIIYYFLRNCPIKVEQLFREFIGNTVEANFEY